MTEMGKQVLDTYEGSINPTKFIHNGEKVKDLKAAQSKIVDKINAEYDAELAALEKQTKPTDVLGSESNPALRDVESTAKIDETIKKSIVKRTETSLGVTADVAAKIHDIALNSKNYDDFRMAAIS